LPPVEFRVLSGQTCIREPPAAIFPRPDGESSFSGRGERSREPRQFATQNGAAEQSGDALRGAKRPGELAAKLGFSEPECRAVVLAVDEALTNIIRHAYLGDPDRSIEASFSRIHVPGEGKSGMRSKLYWKTAESPRIRRKCAAARSRTSGRGLGLALYPRVHGYSRIRPQQRQKSASPGKDIAFAGAPERLLRRIELEDCRAPFGQDHHFRYFGRHRSRDFTGMRKALLRELRELKMPRVVLNLGPFGISTAPAWPPSWKA